MMVGISGAHTDEWWDKTKNFIERAFSLSSTDKIRCPYVKCQNVRCFEELTLRWFHVRFISNYIDKIY
jgi:hypothetical protein